MKRKLDYDGDGKIDLDNIYDQADPRPYFATLKHLEYTIPQHASPVFRRLIDAYRQSRETRQVKLIDVGCSYGVNGALLKYALDMDDLYALYSDEAANELDREALIERDRAVFGTSCDNDLEVMGVDQSGEAVSYAVDAGALDDGFAADFETAAPLSDEAARLEGADMIISTGCYGYISETSLGRVLEPSLENKPWMAHFVLRMFSFDAASDMLAEQGYITEKAPGLFRQRRFASPQERDNAFANLADLGLEPTPREHDGWYVAELHLSRPQAEAALCSAGELLSGVGGAH